MVATYGTDQVVFKERWSLSTGGHKHRFHYFKGNFKGPLTNAFYIHVLNAPAHSK
jgi:hypothetical protein